MKLPIVDESSNIIDSELLYLKHYNHLSQNFICAILDDENDYAVISYKYESCKYIISSVNRGDYLIYEKFQASLVVPTTYFRTLASSPVLRPYIDDKPSDASCDVSVF